MAYGQLVLGHDLLEINLNVDRHIGGLDGL